MKRGTIDHPKMRALVAALPIGGCRYQAVGILESLWHFTALYAYQGDVGRHTDAAIAEWIGWKGSPDSLIEPLVRTGWLNRVDGPERLVVHDWSEHCDDSVKKRMSRDALKPAKCPPHGEICPLTGGICPDMSGHVWPRARGEGQEAIGEGQEALDREGDTGKPKPARRNGYTLWTQDEFRASVETANTDNLLTPAEVDEFCLYWFEPTPTGRERFKTEKTWSTRGRMQTAMRMVYAKQRLFAAKQPTLKGVIPDMGEMKE